MSNGAYSEEDALSLENAFEIELQNLADLESRQHWVIQHRNVDRLTMEALHQKYPEAINADYPVNSFSKDPSDQNLPVSLESFSIAKAVAVCRRRVIGQHLVHVDQAVSHRQRRTTRKRCG